MAAPAPQELQISAFIEKLGSLWNSLPFAELSDGLWALWARDPGAARTIAILAAMAIFVLFLVLRRRRAGASRPSRAVSAGPRAGRYFVPPAAPDPGLAFPEEASSASDLGLEFPEEPSFALGMGLAFPEEPDPVGLKLQLAEAYFDLSDGEGVRHLLEEVLAEGSPEQCQRAEALAERLA